MIQFVKQSRMMGKRQLFLDRVRSEIIYHIRSGKGNETMMIISPDDPVEEVKRTRYIPVWDDQFGESLMVDTYTEFVPKHPVKTFYEWAKEFNVSTV